VSLLSEPRISFRWAYPIRPIIWTASIPAQYISTIVCKRNDGWTGIRLTRQPSLPAATPFERMNLSRCGRTWRFCWKCVNKVCIVPACSIASTHADSTAVYLCHVGTSLAAKLAELSDSASSKCTPIFAFFDIELGRNEDSVRDRRKASRSSWPDAGPPSPTSIRRGFTFSSQSDSSYGLQLLSGVSADIQVSEIPNLVIPIAVLRHSPNEPTSAPASQPSATPLCELQQISKCLDAGAVDVLTTPLDRARVQGLIVHAYRVHKSARKEQSRFLARKKSRKQSWVGVHDEQPYAYLREAMYVHFA
jgi:hypothetical protein